MKHLLTFIFCLVFTITFGQNKGINLIKNTSNDTTFLKENCRIKVRILEGKSIAGKFTIVNYSEINIKGTIIPMDSIVSIRNASTFSVIVSPISTVIGSILIAGSIVLIAEGGLAVIGAALALPVALPLFIVPFTANKHPVKKWKYEIVSD